MIRIMSVNSILILLKHVKMSVQKASHIRFFFLECLVAKFGDICVARAMHMHILSYPCVNVLKPVVHNLQMFP